MCLLWCAVGNQRGMERDNGEQVDMPSHDHAQNGNVGYGLTCVLYCEK